MNKDNNKLVEIEWYPEVEMPNESNDFDDYSLLDRAKNSLFGRFYLKYLKKNSGIKNVVDFLWLFFIPLFFIIKNWIYVFFLNFLSVLTKVFYTTKIYLLLERFRKGVVFDLNSVQSSRVTTKIIDSTSILKPSSAVIYPREISSKVEFPNVSNVVNEISVHNFINCRVASKSNLFFNEQFAYHHCLYNFDKDFTSEELHGRWFIQKNRGQVLFRKKILASGYIIKGAHFLDACSHNYAHWLTEVLPRIAIYVNSGLFKDFPILVDSGLHINIKRSLELIAAGRKIIYIPSQRIFDIGELLFVDAVGYVPFDKRGKEYNKANHGLFHPDAFNVLISMLESKIVNLESKFKDKKVLLLRKSSVRSLINFVQVQEFLEREGFLTIAPEDLTFDEQVQLFRQAEIIVGSTGAAFANLIFRPKGKKVVIFMPLVKNNIYGYWPAMAQSTNGCEVIYIAGQPRKKRNKTIHVDFTISIQDLSLAIQN